MDLKDYRRNLENALRDLNQTREAEALRITFDALALVKRRVINSGERADGGDFGGYSRAVVPFWFHASKEGVTANDIDKLLDQHGYFASYHDLREVKGFKLFKNFSFTNKMWNSIVPTIVEQNDDVVVITFDSPQDAEAMKIIWNTARDGDFLALAEDEERLLTTLNEERVRNILRNNNLI